MELPLSNSQYKKKFITFGKLKKKYQILHSDLSKLSMVCQVFIGTKIETEKDLLHSFRKIYMNVGYFIFSTNANQGLNVLYFLAPTLFHLFFEKKNCFI